MCKTDWYIYIYTHTRVQVMASLNCLMWVILLEQSRWWEQSYSYCSWDKQERGRKCYCGERFWSGWTGASCLRGAGCAACVQGERGQLWSDLHSLVSWSCTGLGELVVCSQSPSQLSTLHAAVCECLWWWRQDTAWRMQFDFLRGGFA